VILCTFSISIALILINHHMAQLYFVHWFVLYIASTLFIVIILSKTIKMT
jgi:hypothetical protein